MRRGVMVAAVLVTVGCGPNEDNWSQKSAKASCEFSRRCAEANFWSTYADMGECRDLSEQALDAEAIEKASACVFDEDQASACLGDLKGSCKAAADEGFLSACFAVWNCGTVDPTGTGGTTTTTSR